MSSNSVRRVINTSRLDRLSLSPCRWLSSGALSLHQSPTHYQPQAFIKPMDYATVVVSVVLFLLSVLSDVYERRWFAKVLLLVCVWFSVGSFASESAAPMYRPGYFHRLNVAIHSIKELLILTKCIVYTFSCDIFTL